MKRVRILTPLLASAVSELRLFAAALESAGDDFSLNYAHDLRQLAARLDDALKARTGFSHRGMKAEPAASRRVRSGLP